MVEYTYDEAFKNKIKSIEFEYGRGILDLDGIGWQLDPNQFNKNFFKATDLSKVSVDANSNVSRKTVNSFFPESAKPHNGLSALYIIWKKLSKKYGIEYANQVLEAVIIGQVYIHDRHSTGYLFYCYAYSLETLMKKGLSFMDNIKSTPAKHLHTFIHHVQQFIMYASNQSAGAVGVPDLFVYMYYFWKKDSENGVYTEDNKDWWLEQEFQSLTYTINQKNVRSGQQSAFTNFTYMDREYIKAFFANKKYPDGTKITNYVEEIIDLQKKYLIWLSKEREKQMFTFPVYSVSLLKDQNGNFLDEDSARFINKHNMKWEDVNTYMSPDITSLSSCCFTGDTEAVIKYNNEIEVEDFSKLYESFKNESIGIYYNGEFKRGHIVRYRSPENLLKITYRISPYMSEREFISTLDHIHVTNNGDKLASELSVNDKLQCFIYTDGGVIIDAEITGLEKIKSKDEYVYCFEMDDKHSPYFTLANGIITHNCRLTSNIEDLGKLEGHFNSIGGSDLNIGSFKVVTINLPRIAYECNNDSVKYKQILKERVTMTQRILWAVRELLKERIDQGAIPLYTEGFAHLNRQFGTIGIVGFFEAMSLLGYAGNSASGLNYNDFNYPKEVLGSIKDMADAGYSEYGFSFNVEQIPAEKAAVLLADKDRVFYDHRFVMYSNQWIPLIGHTDMLNRIKCAKEFDSYTGGGVITHITLGKPFDDEEIRWKFMQLLAKSGVIYSAFNTAIDVCDNNHAFYGEKCPICGGEKVDSYMRIVGYLTPISSWNTIRKEYEFEKRERY